MFLYSAWLKLPIQTRILIANQFNIAKRGATEVFDNKVKSDGYLIDEVESALNVDALQKYLGTEDTDMAVLWERMLAKIEGKTYQEEEKVVGLVSEPVMFNSQTIEPLKKVFCAFCDSRGGRHKKNCTRVK